LRAKEGKPMEMDLKKGFYMLICIVMLGLIGTALAKPTFTKIESQTTRIQTVDFSTSGNTVAP
jgi:mannitol-specific phosphotransferase system IIBC component